MDEKPRNEYLRKLDRWENKDYPAPRMEGGILLTPDGLRWRIEERPLTDVLHVGDQIRTSYDSGGIVVKMHHSLGCCCPLRATSMTKYCADAWDAPERTMQYHMDVWRWTIVYLRPSDLHLKKDRSLNYGAHTCWLNDFVVFNGRILHLFENNTVEIFLVDPRERAAVPVFQMELM